MEYKQQLPTTKDEIVFDDIFLNKILESEKSVTIRNSPVSLGYKKLKQGLDIEILSCEKLEIATGEGDCGNGLYRFFHARTPKDHGFQPVNPFPLGFKNSDAMCDYYKKYLKRDFAYAITFSIVKL